MGRERGPREPPAIDMRGNIIKNGSFRKLTGWDEVHKSNSNDTYSISTRKNHVTFIRGNSGQDGGTVGLVQNLDSKVHTYKNLFLNLDVYIHDHSLKDTGYWAKKHGGIGELPLVLSIKYQDINDGLQLWTIGFITRSHKIKDIGTHQNITLVHQGKWSSHEFDLLNDSFRKDSAGNVLPPPKRILQISVMGKGWDFTSSIGNLKLSSKRSHVRAVDSTRSAVQRAPIYTPETESPPPEDPPSSSRKSRSRSRKGPSDASKQPAKKSPAPPKKSTTRKRAPKKTKEAASPPSPTPTPSPQPTPQPQKASPSRLPKKFKYDRVYVDASNVAHGEKGTKPQVANISLIHTRLYEMGFDTIIIIADASLRHKIDDKDAYEELITSGFVSQAPAKTEADEFLIGFAQQKPGYIITNDKLDKWRKKDDWAKKNLDKLCIQFMIQEDMVLFVGFP